MGGAAAAAAAEEGVECTAASAGAGDTAPPPPLKPEPVPSDAWMFQTWAAFLRTFGLTGSRLRDGDARRLFGHVQNDEQGFDSSAELIFSEFEEALAALAAHWFRDPFVPLYRRLDRFLSKRFAGTPLPELDASPLSLAALPPPTAASLAAKPRPPSPSMGADGAAPSISMGSAFGVGGAASPSMRADSLASASTASGRSGKRSKSRSKSPRRHK